MRENGKSLVAAAVCDTYDEETVYEAVRAGVAAVGGLQALLSPEEKVLVKPNFLKSADAESAVATHPAVIKALLRLLQEYGCTDTVYGDSPGNDTGARVAERLGLEREEPIYGARFTPMTREVKVSFPRGMTEKEFYFAEEVTEADAIINVCKMKTHALMRITGAVKNPFGLVCGHRKAMAHVKYPNASLFARMLADIHRCVKPRLHIMDGIIAMEGNGPGAGNPMPMNLLLFSTDPVAIDTVFCGLIGIDPQSVPTNVQGEAMGIGTCDSGKIEIVLAGEFRRSTDTAGTPREESGKDADAAGSPTKESVTDMVADRGSGKASGMDAETAGASGKKSEISEETVGAPAKVSGLDADTEDAPTNVSARNELNARLVDFERFCKIYGNPKFDVERPKSNMVRGLKVLEHFTRRPVIQAKSCVSCGICVEHCPVPGKALSFVNGRNHPPVYDYKKCIRCYCCQELCPKKAITVGKFGSRYSG